LRIISEKLRTDQKLADRIDAILLRKEDLQSIRNVIMTSDLQDALFQIRNSAQARGTEVAEKIYKSRRGR